MQTSQAIRWPGLNKELGQEGLDAHGYLMPGCACWKNLLRHRMHRCAERGTPCGQRTRKLVASVHWWIPMQPRSVFRLPTADGKPHFDPKHLGQPRAVSIALNTKVNVGLQGHLHRANWLKSESWAGTRPLRQSLSCPPA